MSIQDMQASADTRSSAISQAKKDAEESAVLRKYIVSMGHKDPGPGVSLIHLHALATVLKGEHDKATQNAATDPSVATAPDETNPASNPDGSDPNLADQTQPGPASGTTAPPAKGKQPPWLAKK